MTAARKKTGPTLGQLTVLRAVDSRARAFGHPPTVRELCEHLGFASPHGIHDHLALLRGKGLVDWRPFQARTLLVTRAGHRALARSAP